MTSKIDPSLLNFVGVLGAKRCKIIVYYRDETFLYKVLHDKANTILGYFPFIKAVALEVKYPQIFDFAQDFGVNYITKVTSTHTLINNARKIIKVEDLHHAGIMGQGVNVAVIDTGCYPHLDFMLGKNRIIKFVDLINERSYPYDDNGHGTFVAGVLAGSGAVCSQKYRGIAPLCGVIAIKALKSDGQTQAYKVLEAMQWVYTNYLKYNIRVVCMSFGSNPLSYNDPLTVGANALWQRGIVVVSAVGNDGPKPSSVKSPGSSGRIISVGCADTREEEIKIADFSSRGPIFDYVKPDLVAPGVEITSLSNDTKFYTTMSGTSVSTPFVAGVAVLLLQQNPNLTPNEIKSILLSSAVPMPYDPNTCGAGMLDTESAFRFLKS